VKKVLLYAVGGGLGHVTRADALAFMFPQYQFSILHSVVFPPWLSQKAKKILVQDELNILECFRTLLLDYQPDEIWLDVFPNGIFHELSEILSTCIQKKVWITRILNIENYPIEKIYIDEIWRIEELNASLQILIESFSIPQKEIQIQYPKIAKQSLVFPGTIIAHSGSKDEFEALLKYSKKIFPNEPVFSHTFHSEVIPLSSEFPSFAWFDSAKAIFTGAGFHAVQQGKLFSEKHLMIAFPRKFDLQECRMI